MMDRDHGVPVRWRQEARLSTTLSIYLARHLALSVATVVGAFLAIAFLIDLIEQLRRTSIRENVSALVAIELTIFHMPLLLQQMLPFAFLFGAMLGFQRLTRSQELVVVRAVGVSAWQFLTPAVLVTALCGAASVVVLNPLSAAMLGRFEQLEVTHLSARSAFLALFSEGLWLRQQQGSQELVFHADEVLEDPLRLTNVTVYMLEDKIRFERRLDAPIAELADGRWILENATETKLGSVARSVGEVTIPTTLSLANIENSVQSPETLSVWELPRYIQIIEALGFSARAHILTLHATLATPLFFCAMLLIGVTFSLRVARFGGTGTLIFAGLITGFGFFILSDVVHALGLSGRLPAALAAWTPAGIAVLLGLTALFYSEDG
ncbi:MAG: LPS export ABC transporter permease LptG [Geminicoccaceae bacterium]